MKRPFLKLISLVVMAFGCGRGTVYTRPPVESFFALSAMDIHGNPYSFEQLKGHKVMVVNTASECGFTPQYEELEKLYERYKEKGFIVIGFPSNDFGGQEPGDERTIAAFCTEKYGVTFPMMSKVSTKGAEQHAVYQWLTQKARNGAADNEVKWNFTKFLINEDGSLHRVLGSMTGPMSDVVTDWIEGKK